MRTMVLEDAHQHLPEQFITQSWSKKGSRKGCQKSPWPENDASFRCVRCTWTCSSHHIINGFPQCCLTSLNIGCIFLCYFFWGGVFCFQSGALFLAICYILEQKPVLCWFLELKFAICTVHRFFYGFTWFLHGVHWFTQSVHRFFHSFHWIFRGFNCFFHGFNRFFHA